MLFKFILIGIGGFLGAISRFWISQTLGQKVKTIFPISTLFVNLLGSFLLGFLTGIKIFENFYLFLCIGFLGSFTTFSTLKLEMIHLSLKEKSFNSLFLYTILTYFFGIFLAYLGFLIAQNTSLSLIK